MKKGWIITIAVSVLLAVLLYFYQFHNGLSNNVTDWGSFGDYMNGVLTPILTIVNIWVFVKLTQIISNSELRQNEVELSYQKKLLLMQLRQNEFDKFSTIMHDALVVKPEDIRGNYLLSIVNATTYITSFILSKSELFPIIREERFESKIIELKQLLTEYNQDFFNSGLDNPKDMTPITKKLLDSVGNVTSELQRFILNDIN